MAKLLAKQAFFSRRHWYHYGFNEFGLNDRPVLLGVSRKSLIGKITGPAGRKWGTVALTSYARENGVRILRVHDVKENVQALRMTEAIMAK